MNSENLSNKVKQFRKSKGYSQEFLAESSNLSLRTIQRIENGETIPRGDTLNHLANAFSLTPEELMFGTKDKDRTFLTLLNLSALSFLVFPPLGILVPLFIWIWKRESIQQADKTGKVIINFQISLLLLIPVIFFGIIVSFIIVSIKFEMLTQSGTSFSAGPMPIYAIMTYYIFNTFSILKNTLRIQNNLEVKYWPIFKFIK